MSKRSRRPIGENSTAEFSNSFTLNGPEPSASVIFSLGGKKVKRDVPLKRILDANSGHNSAEKTALAKEFNLNGPVIARIAHTASRAGLTAKGLHA